MTFRRLKKVNSSAPEAGPAGPAPQDHDIYFSSSKSDSCKLEGPASSSEVYNYRTLAYSGGTLPRTYKKGGGPQKWKPLTQSPEPQSEALSSTQRSFMNSEKTWSNSNIFLFRQVVFLEKKEEETFGFEIQTYGLHHQDQNLVEMCTFVCKVHEDSAAQRAGLKLGDTITSVNDTTVEGFRHKDIVQLIKACGNSLRLETFYSDSIRKAELEARLQYLKQSLYEKWDEYRSLMVQEQRLVHGIVMSDAAVYESLESAGLYGSLGAPSPATQRTIRCTGSTSSSASFLSTDDDPLYQTCLYQANGSEDSGIPEKSQEQQRPQRLRPTSELLTVTKTQLTRSASTRSYMRGSSSSSSAGAGEKPGGFSSLQRKPKQKSFRRRLLKFIPGLNRPLEEEESKL